MVTTRVRLFVDLRGRSQDPRPASSFSNKQTKTFFCPGTTTLDIDPARIFTPPLKLKRQLNPRWYHWENVDKLNRLRLEQSLSMGRMG